MSAAPFPFTGATAATGHLLCVVNHGLNNLKHGNHARRRARCCSQAAAGGVAKAATSRRLAISVDLTEDRGLPLKCAAIPGTGLMLQQLHIGGQEFNLVLPANVDALMDDYIASGPKDRDPYWARPWPSAAALASQLQDSVHLVMGKTVADVGSGCGLAGLAAAMAGAKSVTLMDREPLALVCSMLSAVASGIPLSQALLSALSVAATCGTPGIYTAADNSPTREGRSATRGGFSQDGRQRAASSATAIMGGSAARSRVGLGSEIDVNSSETSWPLNGGTVEEVSDALLAELCSLGINVPERQGCGTIDAQLLDWDRPATFGRTRHDVMLATDVLYEAQSVAPIAELAPKLLYSSDGLLLLADPAERTIHNRENFVDLVGRGKVGLVLHEEFEQPVAIDGQQPMMGAPPSPEMEGTAPDESPAEDSQNGSSAPPSQSANMVYIRLMTFKTGWSAGTLQAGG